MYQEEQTKLKNRPLSKNNISEENMFSMAMDYYEGKAVKKDYNKAYNMFNSLAEKGFAKAKLLLVLMKSLGHGTDKKQCTNYEFENTINSVDDTKFLYDLSQKIYNRELFKDDFKQAYECDEELRNMDLPEDLVYNVRNLEIILSCFVRDMSTVAAKRGYIQAKKFINNRVIWIHL